MKKDTVIMSEQSHQQDRFGQGQYDRFGGQQRSSQQSGSLMSSTGSTMKSNAPQEVVDMEQLKIKNIYMKRIENMKIFQAFNFELANPCLLRLVF